jgi:hypothetical protein
MNENRKETGLHTPRRKRGRTGATWTGKEGKLPLPSRGRGARMTLVTWRVYGIGTVRTAKQTRKGRNYEKITTRRIGLTA